MLTEDKTELVIKRENPKTRELFLKNVFLTAAVNIERAVAKYPYASYSIHNYQKHGQELKAGLVVMPFTEFINYKDSNLEIMSRSEAIIVTHGDNDDIRRPFEGLFKKVNEDQNKAQHLRKGWMTIADTCFFFVHKDEMADFEQEFDYSKGYLPTKEVRTPLEKLLAHLEYWGGLKADKALLHIDPENIEDLAAVLQSLENGLEEAEKADQKY